MLDLDGDAQPDMASLTLGSLNFPTQASVNEPAMIRALAERMRERGIVPELEVFDFGMLDYAHYLIERDDPAPALLRQPAARLARHPGRDAVQPGLAGQGAAGQPGATWAGAGIGRFQFFVNSLAITMGGHVRVGLEDNLYLDTRRSS